MKYWNKTLQKMTEYVPGEQPDNLDEYIKLNTNENPFPPSPAVLEALKKSCNSELRRYPSPTAHTVRETFAKQLGLSAENIFIGNGSDEVFSLLFRGFIEKNGVAAFSYPSYSLYCTIAEANGIKYEKINLKENFDVDFDGFLKKKYSMVILCNPNNPTGKGIPVAHIENFLKRYEGLVIVDEAYVDFYGESSAGLIKKYENLIVTRSFSKSYSLAGLRIGVAISNKDNIRGFMKLKDSYNIDRLAITASQAALEDTKTFKYNLEMLRNNKEYFEEQLKALGFEITPSKANFLFVKHAKIESQTLYEELKKRMILVRFFTGKIQSEYLRMTVGTMMEIKKLVIELKDILAVS
jgi:histidinol-phosphate aminotransferase